MCWTVKSRQWLSSGSIIRMHNSSVTVLTKLLEHWQKCVDCKGDYVEK
jgi:hypothetical protein